MSIKNQLRSLEKQIGDLPENSMLSRCIASLAEQFSQKDELFEREYLPLVRKGNSLLNVSPRPFLSVITRTQGKREEMLMETLLSLSAQSDMDFEVILVGHKLDENQTELVEKIISQQTHELRSRIRFIKLDKGNRTAPLNFGFAHARGSYVAILDDDDLVFDNWVEEFHKASKEHYGMILHAFVIMQEWMVIRSEEGKEVLRAAHAPGDVYCTYFDIVRQLSVNYCPILGLAFPAYWFQKKGIIFDEQLSTNEDWDYLMRVAALAGVHDIEVPTSLYRWWLNSEDSKTEHKPDEWIVNRIRIQDKWANMPIVMKANQRMFNQKPEDVPAESETEDYFQLYYGEDISAISELHSIRKSVGCGSFSLSFSMDSYGAISFLRFDPGDKGACIIKDLVMEITDESGELVQTLTIRDASATNGEPNIENNTIVFSQADPQILFTFPLRKLGEVRLRGILADINGSF